MRTPLSALVLACAAFASDPDVAAAQDAAKSATDRSFPREIAVAGRRVHLSEPIVVSRDAATGGIALRFAVRVTDPLGRQTWGVADASGTTHVDLTSRLVRVDGITPGAAAFPQLGEKDRTQVVEALPDQMPRELTLRLELLTAAPWAAPQEPLSQGRLSVLGPEILVRTTPAVLVQTDGEPVLQPVADFPLEYVVNSASDILRDPKAGTWFLHLEDRWMESKAITGPWKPLAGPLPVVLTQLPKDFARGHLRQFVPGTPESAARKAPAPAGDAPEILVRSQPAELVLLRGEPLLTLVPGVKLLSVANTESDLFFHPKAGSFFLLIAGRWFVADDVAGPWKEALGTLPEEFAKIPRDHARGHVVWCVPGTPESAEAAARALLEDRVGIGRAVSLTVQYEGGEPRTVPIEGTDLKLVVNSDDDVVVGDGAWWCCARGVWFRSDDGKSGWKAATTLPPGVAALPEASGLFHLRFCRPLGAGESGPRFAAAGSYAGVFFLKGAPVHGTGHTRRGVLRGGHWYPYPRTWGENRWYDPVSGAFQPRTVRYDARMRAVADEWSPYTASFGRVRHFADRYGQGGRRMFPWAPDRGRFDTAVGRPDAYESWGIQVKDRDGLDPKVLPLGDRSGDEPPSEPAVVADANGTAWRLGASGSETWKDAAWVAADGCGAAEKAWLEALARADARVGQIRAWSARRAAALPVNLVK